MVNSTVEKDLLGVPFSFPSIEEQKVLVLGLGGGCDIISAYAVAQLLPKGRSRGIIYANTKKKNDGSLDMITAHIGRLSSEPPPLGKGRRRTFGTTLIDRGLPRGDEGCPWIFLNPDQEAEKPLLDELLQQGFDLLLGVDTGGDSLVSQALSGDEGRDKRMLRVLERTGLPLFHFVVAPGADGESSYEELNAAFQAPMTWARYRGCVQLDPVWPLLKSLSGTLTPRRTPRIMLAALEGRLKQDKYGWVIVPRGCKPRVPREWLLRAFVFSRDPYLPRESNSQEEQGSRQTRD